MNQENQNPQYNPQVQVSVPQAASEPLRILQKQMCGYVIVILSIIVFSISIINSLSSLFYTRNFNFIYLNIAYTIGCALALFFFSSLAFVPEYAAGKPSALKILPYVAALVIFNICFYLDPRFKFMLNGEIAEKSIFQVIGSSLIVSIIVYCMFLLDDDGGCCCLCFKPWVYKRIPDAYGVYGQPPQGYPQVYPQGQGYPQSYPPQAQGYQSYPPQAQGYPQTPQ